MIGSKASISLATICEALESAHLDATVWCDAGYIWIDSPSEEKIIRLSLDRQARVLS